MIKKGVKLSIAMQEFNKARDEFNFLLFKAKKIGVENTNG